MPETINGVTHPINGDFVNFTGPGAGTGDLGVLAATAGANVAVAAGAAGAAALAAANAYTDQEVAAAQGGASVTVTEDGRLLVDGVDVEPAQVGAAPTIHAHTRAQISDATSTGRDLMAATGAAGARNAIGLGTNQGYPFTPTVRGWILAAADLNDYRTSAQAGAYGMNASAANAPPNMGATSGMVNVWAAPDTSRIVQWVAAQGGAWWRVAQTSGGVTTWQPWQKIVSQSDLDAALAAVTVTKTDLADAAAAVATPDARSQINWFTAFEPGHDWNRTSPGGTVTTEATNTVMGETALLMEANGGVDHVIVTRTGLALDLTTNMLALWVHIDDFAALASIIVYASDTPNLASFDTWRVVASSIAHPWIRDGEWCMVTLPYPATATMSSAVRPNRANISTLRIRVSGVGAKVRIGAVGTRPERHPAFPHGVVSITFDDGYTSTLTRAARLSMTRRGWAGSVAAIPETVGNTGFMTLDQYYELKHVHGWDVEAHNIAEATTLTDEQLRVQWAGDQEWARVNGLGESRHLIWPRGLVDQRTARIASEFFDTARTIDGIHENGLETLPPAMPYRLRSFSIMRADQAIPIIDRAAANGQWAILTFHKVSSDAEWTASGLEVSQSDMDAICDHIAASGMPVRTLDQVWRAIT